MSHSNDDRMKNMVLAVDLMFKALDDRAIDKVFFQFETDPTFKYIFPTTWRELEQRYLIKVERMMGGSLCQLTGYGWRTAVDDFWDELEPKLGPMMSKVAASLKDFVKGRNEDAYVYLDSLAAGSGVPEDIVFNIIESEILDLRFNMKGARWHEGHAPLIHVPLDFGLAPL